MAEKNQAVEVAEEGILDGKLRDLMGHKITEYSLPSRFTFNAVNPLVCGCCNSKKKKQYVDDEDLWSFPGEDVPTVWKMFKPNWESELNQAEPSLFRALRKSFWGLFLKSFILQMIYVASSFVVPVCMPYMLQHLADKFTPAPTPDWHGYLYAIGIFLATLIGSSAYYHAQFNGATLAARLRTILTIMVYKKSLKLRFNAEFSSGRALNMVSSDAQLFSESFTLWISGLVAPIQLIVVTGLLWKEIGAFALIPLAVFVVSLPVNGFVSARFGPLRTKQQLASDSRLKLIRELVSAIRIVKYYAWEVPFEQNINEFRERELERVRITGMNRTLAISVFSGVGPLGTGLTLGFYALSGSFALTKVFTALSLLNLIRTPLQMLPFIFVFTTQYKIALGRVSDFCTRPEISTAPQNAPQKVSIQMKDVSLAWAAEQPVLEGIDMKVKQGEVVMVVGAVGCGKSTLCQAVLQEIPHVTGEVVVNGQLAYVPQEAWIFNATVRDNILFGQPFDEKRYTKVLKMAALGPDLDILPARDMTHIGDRGTNLSGGQKQRVSIARALYADKDVYVFDDPFSAVDSHVAKHLVENAVVKFVRGTGKTAFVATNQLQFLPYANRVIMLQHGRVVANGAFDKLMQEGGAFADLVKEFGVFEEMDDDESSTQSRKLVKSENASAHVETKQKKDEDAAEERETGTIGFGTYWGYIKSGGLGLFLFSLILMFVIGGVRVYYALWLSDWSSTDPAVSGRHVRDTWIGVYIGLILIECVLVPIRLVPIIFWGRNASRALHKGLLGSVIRATTSFFDLTPSGRIISRFSKDMNMIDELLSFQVDQYVQLAVSLLALLAQMASSQPYILIVIGVGLIIFLLLQRAFQKTAVDIQRCEALSRAPILSHLTESIEGATSIRAYGLTKNFNVANFNKVGANIANWMSLRYSIAWFGMRLDWIGSVIILATYLGVFLSRNYTTFTASTLSLAAVAMSSTSNITFILSAVANNAVELETKMNAVERVKQYSRIEQEPPAHIEETKPDAAWPPKGKITFKNLSIAYKGGKRVLDGISGSLKPREKIGIVGRTGAGKSTLITALFRLVEPVDGTIDIDGVDIRTLGLADLRRRLAIIPQTPQMFIGDLRYNLDPFNEKEDKDIWHALEMVNLKSFVESLEGKLQAPVEENGSNYSVGQRQLLAMARALLLDAKILLLDEATAAVDNETDALIQAMVRKNFKNRTVLTIAHRLNTIMDYDRVMVLDKGKLVEFDTPKNLLDDPKTIFSSMVEATGDASAAHLRRIARGEVLVSGETRSKKKSAKSKKSKSNKQRD
eukprot:TRINITY_DN342_c1_g1_i1.p1 TRINITY_DN342_c1_g1~~TRINITY_DN342_c1_g1_i1.p1  ORF type:complete len:1306 (+),score=276.46 TRINITY_DN342_c1_g1_i1:705-4622(+)